MARHSLCLRRSTRFWTCVALTESICIQHPILIKRKTSGHTIHHLFSTFTERNAISEYRDDNDRYSAADFSSLRLSIKKLFHTSQLESLLQEVMIADDYSVQLAELWFTKNFRTGF